MQDKRLLIVGAGFGQLPAIFSAKRMGLKVIVVDKNPSAKGMALADHSYCCDVIDFEGVLEIAKKHSISGIMTMQSDLPVPTIGYVNDSLGLKGVTLRVANTCSNKIETRKRLAELNCSQPRYYIVTDINSALEAAQQLGFPCVVKAPDSSGSRGVVKCKKVDELENALKEAFKYTNKNEVLLEEYIEGLEFGAQTFSVNGICESVLLHNDTLSMPPYMIPIGHSFPFKHLSKDEIDIAINDIKNAIQAVGLVDGPANVDLILDQRTNRVKIIEIGARIGATCLPELVEYHTGINWVEQTILNAIGEAVNLEQKYVRPVAAQIIESKSDGEFNGFSIPSNSISGIIEYEITVENGDLVSKLRKGTDRIGKVLAEGEDVESAERNAKEFAELILINVDAK